MDTPLQIFNRKDKFLELRESILNKRVSSAERKLLSVIIDQFVNQLESTNGIIVSNGKNITLTQALNQIFREFDQTINKTIIDGYVDDISRGQAINGRYFGTFSDDNDKFSSIRSRVQSKVRRRLGFNEDGQLRRNGYLDNFLKDNRIKNQVQELVTRAITGEESIRSIKSELKILVAGDDKVSGQLSNHYRTFINDTYQQVDNLESSLYADELGLQAAYYSGGTINTTRRFCCQRNGLIFTVEEIKKWRTLNFQGKNKNYNPLTDQGGYNCRHRYRYISNKIAIRMRKDLMINDEGELVTKPNTPRQKLKNC